jgi:FixJ family two-component response regulator
MNTASGVEARAGAVAGACRPSVHVVDDEASVRTALCRLLAAHGGYEVIAHDRADSLLQALEDDPDPGCILLDVSLPGLDGLGVQRVLADSAHAKPIIFLTGCADVPMCASAMRAGAVDFLTKPVDEAVLFDAVGRAIARDASARAARSEQETTQSRLDSLTPREREVLTHVMAGRLNKQIAADLGTAEKTVKVHRARGMEKMRVRSVAELVRMVERARFAGQQS